MEKWLRLVKAFVVVAGVLIVLGTGTLVALLVARTGKSPVSLEAPRPVPVPAGLMLVEVAPAGDRILLTLRDDSGRLHLLTVDAASGEPLGFLVLPAGVAADAAW